MLKESEANARTAPTARRPARTAGRQVSNLIFISVGLLSKTSFGCNELQIRKLFEQCELVVQRLIEHLLGNFIVWILVQLVEGIGDCLIDNFHEIGRASCRERV